MWTVWKETLREDEAIKFSVSNKVYHKKAND